MTKNDTFFKVLFAISLALLPLTIFSYLFLPKWAVMVFVAAVLLVKVWLELFKDRKNLSHVIIDAIDSVITYLTLTILFIIAGYLNMALAIVALVFIVIMNILLCVMFKHVYPEFIDAVDYCYMLFECLTLLAFMFLPLEYDMISNIGLFAVILTAAVSIGYKLYAFMRYDVINKNFKHKK